MNTSIVTSGHSAVADIPQRFGFRRDRGFDSRPRPCLDRRSDYRGAVGSDSVDARFRRDARAELRVGAALAGMVRADDGERLGCIRNLSSQGLMLSMPRPLRCGEFVEIFTKNHTLVGQVRWSNDCRAGIALRDSIDVDAVIAGEVHHAPAKQVVVRKPQVRPAAANIARDSHIIAQQMQFFAILAFGVFAALMIALCVHDLLMDVISQIKMGLPA